MRYYLYLDRCFLRTLFSAEGTLDFNIEVVEYSVRKSFSTNNELSVNPSVEKISEDENCCRADCEEKKELSNKNSDFHKGRVGITYDLGNASRVETERKYINIDDITNIKNTNFYHGLVEKIRDNSRTRGSRICEEVGFIEAYATGNREEENSTNGFFQINDSIVWFDKTLLEGNVELIHSMACKVKVIGYTMNCEESRKRKVVKALAIFIE